MHFAKTKGSATCFFNFLLSKPMENWLREDKNQQVRFLFWQRVSQNEVHVPKCLRTNTNQYFLQLLKLLHSTHMFHVPSKFSTSLKEMRELEMGIMYGSIKSCSHTAPSLCSTVVGIPSVSLLTLQHLSLSHPKAWFGISAPVWSPHPKSRDSPVLPDAQCQDSHHGSPFGDDSIT